MAAQDSGLNRVNPGLNRVATCDEGAMFRREQLDRGGGEGDEDVDELLKMQEAFLAKKENPAARVVRVGAAKPPAPPEESAGAVAAAGDAAGAGPDAAAGTAAADAAAHATAAAPSTGRGEGAAPAAQPASITPDIDNILGSVMERAPSRSQPPQPTAQFAAASATSAATTAAHGSDGYGGPAFPDAPHRKQSKFSLARKKASAAAPTSAAAQSVVSSLPSAARAAVDKAGASVLPRAQAAAWAAEARLGSQLPAPVRDVVIRAEASAGAAADAAVERAVQAGHTAAKKAVDAATALAAAATGTGAARPGAARESNDVGASAAAAAAAAGRGRGLGSGDPEFGAVSAGRLATGPAAAAVAAAAGAGASPEDLPPGHMPADPRLEARLRFGLHAEVLGVQGEGEVVQQEQVLLRDSLRSDEGLVPEGYTPTELVVLARSAVPAQRAAAMRMLADVLAAARPSHVHLTALHPSSPIVMLPQWWRPPRVTGGPGVPPAEASAAPAAAAAAAAATGTGTGSASGATASAAGAADAGSAISGVAEASSSEPPAPPVPSPLPAPVVAWAQVWAYVVHDLAVVPHIRLALDDACAPVAAAAARALAAALCAAEDDAVQEEVADACPATGWPSARATYLFRPSASGIWEGQPPEQPPPRPPQPGEDQEPTSPEDVAAVDPVAGLLQMDGLQRIRYLLGVSRPPGSARPLVAALTAIARSSEPAALAIARCPCLLQTLGSMLSPSCLLTDDANDDGGGGGGKEAEVGGSKGGSGAAGGGSRRAGGGGGGGGDGDARPERSMQAPLLHLVRVLCQSSRSAAQLARSDGLLSHLLPHLLIACSALADSGRTASDDTTASSSASTASDLATAASAGAAAAVRGGGGGGGGSARPAPDAEPALVVLEALRLWRVCVHQGVSGGVPSFEDVYLSVGPLLLPPHGDAAPSSADPAGLLTALRWQVCREAHLTVTSLMSHALLSSGPSGDKTLGPPRLQPGTAAALGGATSGALAWLRPDALRAVATAAVARADGRGEPSTAGSGPHNGRVRRPHHHAHPATLLPLPACALGALAASTQLLATYWASVAGSQQQVYGELRRSLAASGLMAPPPLPLSQQGASSVRSQTAATPAVVGAHGALCIALLTRSGGSGGSDGQGGDAVGRALSGAALALAAAGSSLGTGADAGASAAREGGQLWGVGADGASTSLLVSLLALARAAGAGAAAGAAQAPAASPPEQQQQQQQNQQQQTRQNQQQREQLQNLARAALDAASSALVACGARLPPRLPPTALSPWHLVGLGRAQHSARLLVAAAPLAPALPALPHLPSTPPPMDAATGCGDGDGCDSSETQGASAERSGSVERGAAAPPPFPRFGAAARAATADGVTARSGDDVVFSATSVTLSAGTHTRGGSEPAASAHAVHTHAEGEPRHPAAHAHALTEDVHAQALRDEPHGVGAVIAHGYVAVEDTTARLARRGSAAAARGAAVTCTRSVRGGGALLLGAARGTVFVSAGGVRCAALVGTGVALAAGHAAVAAVHGAAVGAAAVAGGMLTAAGGAAAGAVDVAGDGALCGALAAAGAALGAGTAAAGVVRGVADVAYAGGHGIVGTMRRGLRGGAAAVRGDARAAGLRARAVGVAALRRTSAGLARGGRVLRDGARRASAHVAAGAAAGAAIGLHGLLHGAATVARGAGAAGATTARHTLRGAAAAQAGLARGSRAFGAGSAAAARIVAGRGAVPHAPVAAAAGSASVSATTSAALRATVQRAPTAAPAPPAPVSAPSPASAATAAPTPPTAHASRAEPLPAAAPEGARVTLVAAEGCGSGDGCDEEIDVRGSGSGGGDARVVRAALCSLCLCPPGSEALAMDALSAGLAPARVAGTLSAARAHLAAAAGRGARAGWARALVAAAAGVPSHVDALTDVVLSAAPYLCPYSLTPGPGTGNAADGGIRGGDPSALASVLLDSYAASWLSLVSVDRVEAAARGGAPPTHSNPATPPPQQQQQQQPPLPKPSLARPHWEESPPGAAPPASRLPLPPGWPLMEAHQLPGQAAHPVGAALALALGLQLCGSGNARGAAAAAAAAPLSPAFGGMLRWAVNLACLFDSGDLLRSSEGIGAVSGADDDGGGGGGGPAWRDPLARWALAGLLQAGGALASAFADSAFGDPLLGALLAAALLPGSSGATQAAVISALIDARTLHLLPPASRCLGRPEQYTGHSLAPFAAASTRAREQARGTASSVAADAVPAPAASARACDEEAQAEARWSAAAGHRDQRVVAAYLSALCSGALAKAKATSSVAYALTLACLGTSLFDATPLPARVAATAAAAGHAAAADAAAVATRRQLAQLSALQQLPAGVLAELMGAVASRGLPLSEQFDSLQAAAATKGGPGALARLYELRAALSEAAHGSHSNC
ncbi:hypothetical protein FOA52_004671 [Chlamydomonas sp. UWO 241]|nr:hypothetical protein FOA52_004671 [Chlamydomonas sp. UWO 241]